MSTVIAAVIGAVVGSLGGAYLGVAVGADRDDARSNREFLQTQRIAIYGEYLTAVDKSHSLLSRALPEPKTVMRVRELNEIPVPSDQDWQTINDSLESLKPIAGRLQVVGGAKVYDLASELQFDLNQALEPIVFLKACETGGATAEMCSKKELLPEGTFYWAREEFHSDRQEYLEVAQEQLGISD